MQTERAPQHTPQEIHIINLVPEQKPFGLVMGATPEFLDAMHFSLEAVMRQG